MSELQQVFEDQSFGLDTGPQLFSDLFIVLSITRKITDFTETRKWAFFTEEDQFHRKCHGREIVN